MSIKTLRLTHLRGSSRENTGGANLYSYIIQSTFFQSPTLPAELNSPVLLTPVHATDPNTIERNSNEGTPLLSSTTFPVSAHDISSYFSQYTRRFSEWWSKDTFDPRALGFAFGHDKEHYQIMPSHFSKYLSQPILLTWTETLWLSYYRNIPLVMPHSVVTNGITMSVVFGAAFPILSQLFSSNPVLVVFLLFMLCLLIYPATYYSLQKAFPKIYSHAFSFADLMAEGKNLFLILFAALTGLDIGAGAGFAWYSQALLASGFAAVMGEIEKLYQGRFKEMTWDLPTMLSTLKDFLATATIFSIFNTFYLGIQQVFSKTIIATSWTLSLINPGLIVIAIPAIAQVLTHIIEAAHIKMLMPQGDTQII
jgi:hypothetical protein